MNFALVLALLTVTAAAAAPAQEEPVDEPAPDVEQQLDRSARQYSMSVGDSNWYNNNAGTQMVSMQAAGRLRTDVKKKLQLEEEFQTADDVVRRHAYSLRRSCVPVLVQQHIDGTTNFFNKPWDDFRIGFFSSNGNYWIGNELLHQMTTDGKYNLRVELQHRSTSAWVYAEYAMFSVGNEEMQYEVHATGYSGNAGDAFAYHDRSKFTTYDRDNDEYSGNCAAAHGGGFWHKGCVHININSNNIGNYGWWNPSAGSWIYPKTTRMWLLCR